MTDITLADKVAAAEQAIARRDEWISGYGAHAAKDAGIISALEAVLADLRAIEKLYEGNPRIRLAWRWGAEQMREQAAQVARLHPDCAYHIRALPVE